MARFLARGGRKADFDDLDFQVEGEEAEKPKKQKKTNRLKS